jgi:protein-L-isoaspartate(D-aspartate) O-methyltransferase
MDYEHARFNMIEQQIRPWEVLDQDVLDLLSIVKRENFVPAAYRSLAFTDMEIPLNVDGRDFGEFMFAPRVEARLLQELAVRKHEQAVEVGAGSGYMAALLAHRARQVLSLEIVPELAQFAAGNLRRCGVINVAVEARSGADPARALGELRYDVIALSGSLPFVPDAWLQRLNVGGRMAAIVGEAPAMTAQIITRRTDTSFDTRNLFETSVQALTGFPRKDHFRF